MAKKRPTKYAAVIGGLRKDFGLDIAKQEKVNAVKDAIRNSAPPEKGSITSEVVTDLVGDIAAMQKVLNDELMLAAAGNLTGANLARVWKDLRYLKDVFKEQQKITEVLLESYKQLMIMQYEVEGTKSIGLASGETIRIQEEPRAKVIDRIALRKWAVENGYEDSLILPWPLINSRAKDLLLEGAPEPDGVELIAWTKAVRG